MPGQYESLMLMLRSAPSLQGVSCLFGEEFINAEEATLGAVCVVPVGGPWQAPGIGFADAPVDAETVWQTTETVNVYLWSSNDPNSSTPPSPEQNADAVNDLCNRVLAAFQRQQVPGGLYYYPTNGQWSRMGDGMNRYGRGYVLSFTVIRPFVYQPYVMADVTSTELDPITFEEGN